jgi:hypothetical protein
MIMDKWDKNEDDRGMGFWGFLNFDRFYHKGKLSRIFMNIMVLMGVAHLAIFTMWASETIMWSLR